MNNFKTTITKKQQSKLKLLSELICENFSRYTKNCELVTDTSVAEIQGNSISGWWAWQDGGYSISAYIDGGYFSGNFLTTDMQANFERLESDFLEDNIELDQDTFYELESEYFSECEALITVELYFKDDMFHFRYSVNYSDMPYYRTQYAETIKEYSCSISDFMSNKFDIVFNSLQGN